MLKKKREKRKKGSIPVPSRSFDQEGKRRNQRGRPFACVYELLSVSLIPVAPQRGEGWGFRTRLTIQDLAEWQGKKRG